MPARKILAAVQLGLALSALTTDVLTTDALRAEALPTTTPDDAVARRPNVLWIIVEDMSAHFGCYGEASISTPNVDRLAREGIRFTNAVVTAPVCSAARSALITGRYQTSIGAHHHRSGRGELKIRRPDDTPLVPELFRAAGYHVANLSIQDFLRSTRATERDPRVRVAKTDYNFEWDESVYARTHWSRRPAGEPFFIQVQLRGGKLRGKGNGVKWPETVREALGSTTPHASVKLPPYLPEDETIVEDWAQYLDTARYTDHEVGAILARLEAADELDRTHIFFITDHGVSHARNKQFCYDGGVHIPLIVRGPGLAAGSTRTDPVEHIDLAASSLALAGIEAPRAMEARDILAADYRPREHVFSARDRCDETVDRIRSVRTERFKYIRNFYPERPYLQPNAYKDAKPILQALRRLHAEGKLNAAQSLQLATRRPAEELYDLRSDPHEIHNLATSPEHAERLAALRAALNAWIARTGDRGETPESEAMYDSDMAGYRTRSPEIERNIEQMKAWAKAGK